MSTTIDLSPFCADPGETKRYATTKPWLAPGGVVRATDGRVLIQVDRALCPEADIPEGRVPKSVDEILGPIEGIQEWHPCKPPTGGCGECEDGVLWEECRSCYGNGEHSCSCGHEHECGDCGGDGKEYAGLCQDCLYEFLGRWLRSKYMRSIAALPNCELGVNEAVDKAGHLVFFRFTGGVGAMCVVDREKAKTP